MDAAIFDMDGLLIDSEPFWRQAEQEIFARVDLLLDDDMCAATTGLRVDEVVAYWFQRRPWKGPSKELVANDIVRRVAELVRWCGQPLPGAENAVEQTRMAGLKLAVASSSPPLLIEAALERLELRRHFQVVHSAVLEQRGKPDPAVYLSAARQLGVATNRCVAFEDSIPGVIAAKAAGMTVISVPAAPHFDDEGFAAADVKLRSLTDFSLDLVPGVEGLVN